MDVVVDLVDGRVWLDAWGRLDSLVVLVDGGPAGGPDAGAEDRLSVVLRGAGAGRVDGAGDALLPPDLLRRLAATAASAEGREVDAGWDGGFVGMLDYAGTKGWIDDDGAVRAHVEWRDV